MPHLTVMMAAYRAQDTVVAAANAALRAMPRDAELVIAVDGPDQETLAAVERVADPRVRVINDDRNIGTARRHTQMLQESDSELVANIDADDVCFPWRFRATLPLLASRADFAFGTAIWFGPRTVQPKAPVGLRPAEVAGCLPFFVPVLHSSMAARREALERVGGYRAIGYAEDWELWMRAAARGARLWKVAVPVVGYRLSESQMTRNVDVFEREHDSSALVAAQDELLHTLGLPSRRTPTGEIRLHEAELQGLLAGMRNRTRSYAEKRIRAKAVIEG